MNRTLKPEQNLQHHNTKIIRNIFKLALKLQRRMKSYRLIINIERSQKQNFLCFTTTPFTLFLCFWNTMCIYIKWRRKRMSTCINSSLHSFLPPTSPHYQPNTSLSKVLTKIKPTRRWKLTDKRKRNDERDLLDPAD